MRNLLAILKHPLSITLIALIGSFVFFYWILPLFTAPLPFNLILLYLALTLSALMIYYTMSGASLEEFMGPIHRFLAGEMPGGLAKIARIGLLILFPLVIGGWLPYTNLVPSDFPPAESRTIHPAPPGEFVGLANPLQPTETNIQIGKGIYASRCSPCHGGNFDGKGSAAPGFNPPPANFRDSGTIAQLQESFLFWRIKKGGVGLPIEGMPWKSAMPRWEVELTDKQVWQVIMGECDGAGQSPRTWEEEE